MFEYEHDYLISLYNLLSSVPNDELGRVNVRVTLSLNDWELIMRLLCDLGLKGLYMFPDRLVDILNEIYNQMPYEIQDED